ncbi:DUF1475 family protein [bacterium]|nr:DUF1475 family protein [bacterium]
MGALRIMFSLVLVGMAYVVVSTSYQSNLFDLIRTWDSTNVMAPWFSATLWDFYANVLFIFVWIVYKETSVYRRIFWFILLVCLGSIATAAYVLIQLFRMNPEDGLEALFIRNNGGKQN